jgi:hypothetical protein
MILLVNQNFVFLYAFIIVAYWKTETGWRKWVFSALSLVSVSFLVSGFTWEVVYPIFLVGFGYYRFLGKKRQLKTLPSGKDLPLCEDSPELPCLTRH